MFVIGRPIERRENYPGPATFGRPPSVENTKYTKMCHFKKQSSKIFSPVGPHENVFPRPRCGSRRLWSLHSSNFWDPKATTFTWFVTTYNKLPFSHGVTLVIHILHCRNERSRSTTASICKKVKNV